MEDLKALVLAAGKSSRIVSISGGQPKPLIRIAGETVLGRNLCWLSRQGIRQVWINLHYRAEEIQAAIGDGARYGLCVRYLYEPEILGTAGAMRNLTSEWVSTFLVVYGDNLLRLDLKAFRAFHDCRKPLVSMALFDRTKHPHTGVAGGRVKLDADGRIREFCEGSSDEAMPLVNAGVYLLEPDVLRDIPPQGGYDFGKDLFPRLLASGVPLYGSVLSGYCLGIDTPESYGNAVRLIENKEVDLS